MSFPNFKACFTVLSVLSLRAQARSWTDIDTLHSLTSIDDGGSTFLSTQENITFLPDSEWALLMANTTTPSLQGIPSTNRPSPAPSSFPSAAPTSRPSASPTAEPTADPTAEPTADPTAEPTPSPTATKVSRGYFNYNPSSSYGPDRWDRVDLPEGKYYWDEFGSRGFGPWKETLAGHDLHRNFCSRGRKQSPIDLFHRDGAICHDFHEVRSLRGDFGVSGNNVERLIQANKLRLKYKRRPCADVENDERCREPDPPRADFPNGWPGMADVLHIDLKIPSEHTVRGRRYDAEMQINHLHAENRRLATQSVLIQAKRDGYNYYFQEALDAFAREYDDNRSQCRRRRTSENLEYAEQDAFDRLSNSTRNLKERKFEGGAWDPHHKMLIPTIHFYRYEGSITEPPCTEFVTWFVADKPMVISFEQLELMKVMLFTNVNAKTCKKSSVQSGESVARPIQKLYDRGVYQCTPGDFGPDPPV